MTLPAALVALLYALLLGSLFHLWTDGGARRLLLYLALSVAGAAAGQWLGSRLGWSLWRAGPLDIGLLTAGSLVTLGLGYWLRLVEFRREDKPGS
jgi:hypothetical protein